MRFIRFFSIGAAVGSYPHEKRAAELFNKMMIQSQDGEFLTNLMNSNSDDMELVTLALLHHSADIATKLRAVNFYWATRLCEDTLNIPLTIIDIAKTTGGEKSQQYLTAVYESFIATIGEYPLKRQPTDIRESIALANELTTYRTIFAVLSDLTVVSGQRINFQADLSPLAPFWTMLVDTMSQLLQVDFITGESYEGFRVFEEFFMSYITMAPNDASSFCKTVAKWKYAIQSFNEDFWHTKGIPLLAQDCPNEFGDLQHRWGYIRSHTTPTGSRLVDLSGKFILKSTYTAWKRDDTIFSRDVQAIRFHTLTTTQWYSKLLSEMVDGAFGLFQPSSGTQGGKLTNNIRTRLRFTGALLARSILDGQSLPISFSTRIYKYLINGAENPRFDLADCPDTTRSVTECRESLIDSSGAMKELLTGFYSVIPEDLLRHRISAGELKAKMFTRGQPGAIDVSYISRMWSKLDTIIMNSVDVDFVSNDAIKNLHTLEPFVNEYISTYPRDNPDSIQRPDQLVPTPFCETLLRWKPMIMSFASNEFWGNSGLRYLARMCPTEYGSLEKRWGFVRDLTRTTEGTSVIIPIRDSIVMDAFTAWSENETIFGHTVLSIQYGHMSSRTWFNQVSKGLVNPKFGLFTDSGVFAELNDTNKNRFRFLGAFMARSLLSGIKLPIGFSSRVYKFIINWTGSLQLDASDYPGGVPEDVHGKILAEKTGTVGEIATGFRSLIPLHVLRNRITPNELLGNI